MQRLDDLVSFNTSTAWRWQRKFQWLASKNCMPAWACVSPRRSGQSEEHLPRNRIELVLRRTFDACNHPVKFHTRFLQHALRTDVLGRASTLDPRKLDIVKTESQHC